MTATKDVAALLREQRDLRSWRQARGQKAAAPSLAPLGVVTRLQEQE